MKKAKKEPEESPPRATTTSGGSYHNEWWIMCTVRPRRPRMNAPAWAFPSGKRGHRDERWFE